MEDRGWLGEKEFFEKVIPNLAPMATKGSALQARGEILGPTLSPEKALGKIERMLSDQQHVDEPMWKAIHEAKDRKEAHAYLNEVAEAK